MAGEMTVRALRTARSSAPRMKLAHSRETSMAKKQAVSFKLNGKEVDVVVEPRELLIHTLREKLQHTGPHIGCETSHCGACTVDLDGMSVKSCTVLTVQCDGAEMLTIEGFAHGGELHALQEAFHLDHALQCGYCTPGMITRAYRLLKENPNPSEEEIRYWMAGNLCRCTGYQNIVKAVQSAAKKLVGASRRLTELPPENHMPCRRHARTRTETGRNGRLAEAQGRRALHPRPGQLRRRHQAAGHAVRRDRAQPLRARAHQVDRQERRRWRCRAWSRC